MLDFVILHHKFPDNCDRSDHWDLMLRQGDELLTWALDQNPVEESQAIGNRLPNHRLEYLDYEGPIHGGRGIVERVAAGNFEWTQHTDLQNWSIEWTTIDNQRFSCQHTNGKSFKIKKLA